MGRKGRARKSSKSGQKAARERGGKAASSSAALNPAVSNPFEQRTNKKLHSEALGRRVRGADRNVAIARSRAVAKREQDLIPEYLTEGRSNAFTDRRIGEGRSDEPMTQEDKALARFRKERKLQAAAVRQGKAQRKFNLGDGDAGGDDGGEDLTHFGRPLAPGAGFDFRPEHEEEADSEPRGPPQSRRRSRRRRRPALVARRPRLRPARLPPAPSPAPSPPPQWTRR